MFIFKKKRNLPRDMDSSISTNGVKYSFLYTYPIVKTLFSLTHARILQFSSNNLFRHGNSLHSDLGVSLVTHELAADLNKLR